MVLGYVVTQALYVCARLGIADALVDGPRPVAALAEVSGAQPTELYRVLRALASVGVFAEEDGGSFRLTPLAECLRSDVTGSLRGYAILHGSPDITGVMNGFLHGIQTGDRPFEHVYGTDIFGYVQAHPDLGARFHAAMGDRTRMVDGAILEAFDFSASRTLVDVGGGRGVLLAGVLQAYPGINGVLFDLPDVVARAEPVLALDDVRDRCKVVGGDFFGSVPAGGDAYMLKSIIHDWDDEHAITILRNCRTAMSPNSTLLLMETVIPPGNEPFVGKIHDLLMLAIGGRERTEAEFNALLTAAGFELKRIIPTRSATSILEAAPV
jgi:hypothetical protein